MKPEGGMTLIISVGGGKPPHHGDSRKKDKKGCEMIKLPLDALVSDTEEGAAIAPEVGDVVVLEQVEGEVVGINEDGTAHVELKTAGGKPIEYVEAEVEVAPEEGMDTMGKQLLEAAVAEDEGLGK